VIAGIDHVVIYAGDTERTIAFYRDVLGATVEGEDEWRAGRRPVFGLRFANGWYLNVHPAGRELHPRAALARPGTLDLCLRTSITADAVARHLDSKGIQIEVGPASRVDATGVPAISHYIRDPDGNLVELMSPAPSS
jgi:catechol 2,3-dioxygenase-like lactoylglutathione lyase family enzyme